MTMQTITGLFDSHTEARQAVSELEAAGVSASAIDMVCDAKDARGGDPTAPQWTSAGTATTIGAVLGGGAGFFAGMGILALPGFGSVAAAGWLAVTATGALAGAFAGGLSGTRSDPDIDGLRPYAQAIRRGGTLLIARVEDSVARTTRAILVRNRAIHLEIRSGRASDWADLEGAVPARGGRPETHGAHPQYGDRMRV